MQENVGYFQITVNDIFLSQIVKPTENISDDWLGLLLGKVVLFPEFGLQVASIAELSDDIAVAIAGEDFVALQNIGMVEFFQHIDFRKEQLL